MRILLLHASAGAGHRRAAEVLAGAFRKEGAWVETRDILDFAPPLFRKTYAAGYLNLVRVAPELWGYMYGLTDRRCRRPWDRHVRQIFNRINTLSFRKFLRLVSPDAVVCTHFLPLELMGGKRGKTFRPGLLFGVVTDFAAHSLWVADAVDAYAVASDEAARQLVRRGVPAADVHVTGIPVAEEFHRQRGGGTASIRLGLRPDRPVILVLCGGFGVGPAAEILRAFNRNPLDAQLVFVAGRNSALERSLRRLAARGTMPCFVQGYVSNLHEWIHAADVVLSKPGGLTVSEVLASGRPLVITDPIPGQEQRNGEWAMERGAAVRLVEPADAPDKIAALLGNPARMADLREAAVRAASPDAAADIVRLVVGRLRHAGAGGIPAGGDRSGIR